MRLFAYGTLEHKPLISKIVKHRLRATEARLNGYACYYVRGKSYPGIVKNSKAYVEGTVYSHVSCRDLKRLDKYEDGYYFRCIRDILTPDNKRYQAYVYAILPRKLACLSKRPWRRTCKAIFER